MHYSININTHFLNHKVTSKLYLLYIIYIKTCHNSVQFLSNGVSAVKSIILLNIKCLQLSKTKGNSDKEPKQDQAQSGNQFSSDQTNERGVIIPGCITSQIVD